VAHGEAFTLHDIVSVLTGLSVEGGPQVSEFVVDSRQAREDSVFVALAGARTDGHLYIKDAFARGAACAIVERALDAGVTLDLRATARTTRDKVPPPPVCLLVEDSLAALQKLAQWWRARWGLEWQPKGRVIGITGSVGKTTTKESTASVLAQHFAVLKSAGNYNNEIGLPLTLLQLRRQHERVVLEMGMYALGEIALLAEIARPHIGLVTNVGPVHLERVGSIERIAQAKAELVEALPADGVALLNGDDPRVWAMKDKTKARVFTFGTTPRCDLWAGPVKSAGLEGIRFSFYHRGQEIPVHLPVLGRHSVHTALGAAAIGLVDGLSWDEIVQGLCVGEQLRLVIVPGIRGATLIDDTYNSSPDSAIAALDLLDELEGRRIAVLGDMLELGEYEAQGHERVGRRVKDVAALLITVGELGWLIGRHAVAHGMAPERVVHAADNAEAVERLRALLREGDVVLIKGSRGIAMEEIVTALAQPRSGVPG